MPGRSFVQTIFQPCGGHLDPRQGPWCLRVFSKETTMEIAIFALCIVSGYIISRPIVRAMGM